MGREDAICLHDWYSQAPIGIVAETNGAQVAPEREIRMHVPTAPLTDTEPESIHVRRVVALAIIAALGGFLFGYDSSVINGANKAVFANFNITEGFVQGFVVSIALLGSALGAFIGGRFAQKYGRKRVMLVAAALFLVAGIGTGLPIGIYDFMFWRVVGGFAIGLAAVVSPMYIAEIAPAKYRGRLISLFQFAIVIGIFATQLVNQVIVTIAGGSASNEIGPLEAWQWMFILMVIPAAIYGLLAAGLPESPRYLVGIGRFDQAKKVLESIFVGDVEPKIKSIRDSIDSEAKPTFSDLRSKKHLILPVVWLGLGLAVFQQFVGINAVFYYSNLIWSSVGFPESEAFTTSTIISLVNVVFTVVAILLIDRVGRKPLLLVGSCGMALTLGTLAVLFATAPKIVAGPRGCSVNRGPSDPLRHRRHHRRPRPQHLRCLLCRNLGPDRLGAAWRDVPQLDPSRRPQRDRDGELARQLRRVGNVSRPRQCLARPRLRVVHALRRPLDLLCLEVRQRDQGCRARSDGRARERTQTRITQSHADRSTPCRRQRR